MQLTNIIATGIIYTMLDSLMCILWIVAYTLVLVGTVRYRYPLISPVTQAIIAPFEFSVVFLYMKIGMFGFNYATVAYLYWTAIEIAIIAVILRLGYIKKSLIVPYIGFLVAVTGCMVYMVTIKEHMFFFSYFNTFLGVLVWFKFILNVNYPMKPITLAVFIIKLIADFFAFLVYFDNGFWATKVMSVLLPLLDAAFLFIYFSKKSKTR